MAVHPLSSILSRTRLRFNLKILISAPAIRDLRAGSYGVHIFPVTWTLQETNKNARVQKKKETRYPALVTVAV